MSSAGRKKDNLEIFNVSEAAAFTVSKTYHGLEQDGVRIYVDQSIGKVTTIKVFTSGSNSTTERLVEEFTVKGFSTEILRAPTMSSVRIEVSSDFASLLSLVTKPSSTAALVDTDAKQTESDERENNLEVRHDELLCVFDKILTELKKNNTYFAIMLDHEIQDIK